MNLQNFRGTPEGLKLRFKGFERNLSLGAPETAKSKDGYSRNFKCLSFVLFPFYDSYHILCCVTLITSNALQIV